MKKRLLTTGLICFVISLAFQNPSFAIDKNFRNVFNPVVVKGVVRDQDGNPLAGATITEKGTTNTVVSGSNGEFSINVRDRATLTVSYVGYDPQDITVVSGRDVAVAMGRQERSN